MRSSPPTVHDGSLRLRDTPMILMYHGVADVAEDPNLLCVSPARFAEQMAWLARQGLRGVGVGTLVEAMRDGRQRGLVGITFDDGYASVLEAALPVLRRHGFGATAYIISDRIGGTNEWDEGPSWPLMTADQVRELAAAGIEIGSHAATHMRLAGATPAQLAAEVSSSKASLAALLGTEIRGFAYPYGSMDAAARQAVRDAGYEHACAVEASLPEMGLMALPRIYVGQQDDAKRLAAKRLLHRGRIALRSRPGSTGDEATSRPPRGERSMKVLHVITGLDAGGAELQLAMILRRTRHESDVVTLYNPGPVAEMIRAKGTSVRDIGMQRNTELPALLRLRKLIKDGRYDVVHTHLYRAQVYARPAAWLAGTPVVLTTEHSIGETHIERRKMTSSVRALYLASEMFSHATIAVSDIVKDRLARWGVRPGKIIVIPNGVDTDDLGFDAGARDRVRAQFGISPDTYVIGALGRLDPNKRVDLTMEAAAPMLGDKCKILVIGRGEDQARLEAAAKRIGVTDHVIFGGYQSDTTAMLAAFDLYVAASLQETFGLSVLEALASGLPVLYTTCPALDGIQTERARMVAGTAEALREEIRKEIETGPRPRIADSKVFDRYGIESVVNRIDDLYEKILATRPRRAQRKAARRRRAG
jgi:glycosyltransferase involved in cell wall biosynthesis/peptidoglycan/xylan/chitin deacetylase (PgdA/CDA1 family)